MGGRIVPVKFAMYTHALQDGDCNYRQDDIPVAPMHVLYILNRRKQTVTLSLVRVIVVA